MTALTRRDAIGFGARAAFAAGLWSALSRTTWAALPPVSGWTEEDERLLNVIGDTILPATPGSAGAGSVGIGRFILTMTAECHPPPAAELLRAVLREIEVASQRSHAKAFGELRTSEREAILTAYEQQPLPKGSASRSHPFRHVKELTLLGYFTSETGATQALRYDPVPGTYRGSVPLTPNDRSWAT